jgi:flavin-dependent dehydrogenase
MKTMYDVCVFGVGPAGASTAARLADAGVAAIVLDRPREKKPWGGESLTGTIRQPLSVLGLWEDFRAAAHVEGYERRTAWGGAPWTHDSIFDQYGHLWHVDRERFDGDLRRAVHARGIPILDYSRLEALRREGGAWHIGLEQGRQISARYLVDATGRACAIARRLGVRPRAYDRLIAFTALIPRNRNPAFDHAMVIESTPHGWWYSAPVPRGHVLAFFTDADLAPRGLGRSMRAVAAHSAFAQSEPEQGWLTVGDACAAHDPLCGWGVCCALSNGILAADAIDHYLKWGQASRLEEYRRHCRDQFAGYLRGLSRHYSFERRWPASPFWERRTSPVPLLV